MRNYRKEYLNYHSSTEQKKKRASRNAARATMVASGKASKGDGKDVDHMNGNPSDNSTSNLTVKTKQIIEVFRAILKRKSGRK
jgi:hypothetical protein